MKVDINENPFRVTCEKGERITVSFDTLPTNALSRITYCFDKVCLKADHKRVNGSQFSFTVEKELFFLQIFFFYIPDDQDIGRTNITITSDKGDSFSDPITVFEDTTGLLPRRMYIFEIV